jgi:hypothetical protein
MDDRELRRQAQVMEQAVAEQRGRRLVNNLTGCAFVLFLLVTLPPLCFLGLSLLAVVGINIGVSNP